MTEFIYAQEHALRKAEKEIAGLKEKLAAAERENAELRKQSECPYSDMKYFICGKVGALRAQLSAAEKKLSAGQSDCGNAKCGHNRYWTTVFGSCMACRAEKAEKENAELKRYEAEWHGMRKETETLRAQLSQAQNQRDALKEDYDSLRADLGTERLRLAACSVAAMSNTDETVAERIGKEHPYYSASYSDVCAAVDREVALRSQLSASEEKVKVLIEAGNMIDFSFPRGCIKGGELFFSIDGVQFKVDCYDLSVGKVGADRIGAFHRFLDAWAKAKEMP